MSDVEFCITEAVRHAREEMTYANALRFLDGLAKLGGDADEVHALRCTLIGMAASDAQLELIASGQLKLNLGGNGQ